MGTKLVDYGIHNEGSDIRAHVCPLAGCVYVFQTEQGRKLAASGKYKAVPVFTQGIKTAVGYPVPVNDILDHHAVSIPETDPPIVFCQADDTSTKGRKAVAVVLSLLERGEMPLWIKRQSESGELNIQIKGADIILSSLCRIQVKCDYKGGVGDGCSGNLFLQIQECNPMGAH